VPCVHRGQRPLEAGIGLVADRIRTGRLKVKGTLGRTIEEAGKYRYDGQGEKPIDADNHLLAALRYLVVAIDRNRSVADRPPLPDDRAEAAREAEERRRRRESHASSDNDLWWT
jgi:hypothetical protein